MNVSRQSVGARKRSKSPTGKRKGKKTDRGNEWDRRTANDLYARENQDHPTFRPVVLQLISMGDAARLVGDTASMPAGMLVAWETSKKRNIVGSEQCRSFGDGAIGRLQLGVAKSNSRT